MDPIQGELPHPMVAVRQSENQNSLHAATASSKTSGKAEITTAQQQSATDAESSGAQASPPGGQEGHAPVQKDQSNESTDDKDDTTAKVMSQTSKIIEPASLAESDARTIAHNRAPGRALGDAGRQMAQSIASATKMAKQSIWGQSSLIWQADDMEEGDEKLVRRLEEQLNAAKQRLSIASSTTSSGMRGRSPNAQGRDSDSASANVTEQADADAACTAKEDSAKSTSPNVTPPPPPDDEDAEWLREKTRRDDQRELARMRRERDEHAAQMAQMQNEHRQQMEQLMQEANAQRREHMLEQQLQAMQIEMRYMKERNEEAAASRERAARDEEARREDAAERRSERDKEWKVKELYSEQLTRCPIDKAASFMETWMVGLAAAATGVCPQAAEIIKKVTAHDDKVFELLRDPLYVKADMWLARQIIGCVKTDSDAAKVFHLETSADLSIRSSGIRLLHDLRVRSKTTSTLSEHAAETRFKSTVYLKGAMTLDQVKLGAAAFKADFEARSEQYAKSHYLMLQALLDELPPALQPGQSNVVKEEKIKLERAHEKQKTGKAELPSWDEFLIDIAIMLKDVTGQRTKTTAPREINEAEKQKGSYKGALAGKGKGTGRAGTASTGSGKGKGKGGKGDRPLKCNVCNKAGVTTKTCGCAPCSTCQLRYCTGAPGATKVTGLRCAQEMTVFPTYNEYVQAGGKLPGFLDGLPV